MQHESDFNHDQITGSHIGEHQPPMRQKPKRKGLHPVILAVICLLLLGGSFVAGMQYQKAKQTDTQAVNANGMPGTFGGGMRQRAGGFGTVTAVSDTSITITLRSFGPDSSSGDTSKTYTIDSSTKITSDGATATASDIQTGDTVIIRTGSSTSTIATQITLNPSMGGGPGAPSGTQQSETDTGNSSSSTSSI